MNGAGPPSGLSAWGDFISKVGFPVVAAGFLAWAVWHLSKSVTDIETTLHNRDAVFQKLDRGQDTGHADLSRMDKDIQILSADHRVMARRLDDLYHAHGLKVTTQEQLEQEKPGVPR
jgi:hypothetical protein